MKDLLGAHKVIALDSCIWIYHLENHPEYAALTRQVLEAVEGGSCQAVSSELTLLEILVRPLQKELQDVADEYELLLSSFPHLTLEPISRDILLQAAEIRALHGLRTPDAIVVATAIAAGATLLITNDRHFSRVSGIQVSCLSEYPR
ncbi:MAG: type II toxin-antitoxin system VapC family toxin [Geobacteraceae bacterium]|nr:type II toxin-antitoxin system VapC family toxin [Geobacteraceae bacterium]